MYARYFDDTGEAQFPQLAGAISHLPPGARLPAPCRALRAIYGFERRHAAP